MRKIHLVNGHVVYVYWIDTVYVLNNLPTEFSKRGGGMMFKKYFSISYMYNTVSDHFSPKIKLYI